MAAAGGGSGGAAVFEYARRCALWDCSPLFTARVGVIAFRILGGSAALSSDWVFAVITPLTNDHATPLPTAATSTLLFDFTCKLPSQP